MEIKKLANEMVDTLRESVWNKIDQEVTDERWNNIGFTFKQWFESGSARATNFEYAYKILGFATK